MYAHHRLKRLLANNELERKWKETTAAKSKTLPPAFACGD